jgi:hypothetical protein
MTPRAFFREVFPVYEIYPLSKGRALIKLHRESSPPRGEPCSGRKTDTPCFPNS